MKAKYLLIVNSLTFVFFSVYFYLNTTECEAYFMHDASINISPMALTTTCAFLFIGPAITQFIQIFILRKSGLTVSLFQYFLGLASIGLLTLSINKPCEFINGGHYMFINFGSTGMSYFLRFICYVIFGLTFLRTFLNLIARKRLEEN
jgi:hypothetical protein